MDQEDLSLKTLIRAVSEELRTSQDERIARGQPPLFEVQELTVEVSFVITESKGGHGGFDLKVIKADANVKYDKESVHKVTLKLKALEKADLTIPELPDEVRVRPRDDD
jgi:hypothetical protein